MVPDGSAYGADIIAITFERIGHHLIVSDALSGVTDKAGIAAELGGRLGRVIGLGGTIDPGILEATSVVVAERFGLELTEFAAEIGDDDAIAAAVVAGIAWRNDTSITTDTHAIVIDALHRQEVCAAALTMLFRLAARPDHPLNVDYLHEFLTRLNVGARDSFIPGWFHDSHSTSGAVDRLIRWAREKPLDQVGEKTARLWVTALLWSTSATDRRVRDPATIAAARLLPGTPGSLPAFFERFTNVDDEWVVERACAVAYAALLANGSADDWIAAAELVSKNVFSVSSAVTPNAAVRDAARSILEAAADRGALPAGVTAAQFRPPYSSDWPIAWPTKADIDGYDTNDYPKLVFSTTDDDFFTYQLSPELRDRPGIDLDAAARWVVEEVIRLGYRPEWHASVRRVRPREVRHGPLQARLDRTHWQEVPVDCAQPTPRHRLRPRPEDPQLVGPAGATDPRPTNRHLSPGRPNRRGVRTRRPDPTRVGARVRLDAHPRQDRRGLDRRRH